jgi:hypothetical protein
LKSGVVISPGLLFLLRVASAIQGFHVSILVLELFFSISVKNVTGVLMVIALNLYIAFGSMANP